MVPGRATTADAEDPYQATLTTDHTGDRFRHFNAYTRSRTACLHCGGSLPWADYSWKYIAAGGVIEGPFCAPACLWGWLNDA